MNLSEGLRLSMYIGDVTAKLYNWCGEALMQDASMGAQKSETIDNTRGESLIPVTATSFESARLQGADRTRMPVRLTMLRMTWMVTPGPKGIKGLDNLTGSPPVAICSALNASWEFRVCDPKLISVSAIALQKHAINALPMVSLIRWYNGPNMMNCGQLGITHAQPPVHPAANPLWNVRPYSSNAEDSWSWLANVSALRSGVRAKMTNGPPNAPARMRGTSGNLTLGSSPLLKRFGHTLVKILLRLPGCAELLLAGGMLTAP
mmetsp:Transcript_35595/g.81570  ORF Transcript_35595/g.81570 Transcript_35595/m.81570 type:complete len:262 (+) Transcript_35595:303-1088(+)